MILCWLFLFCRQLGEEFDGDVGYLTCSNTWTDIINQYCLSVIS